MADGFVPLFAALLIILSATVVRFRFDFMEPAVIVVGMMTLSTFFALFTVERWHFGLSVEGFFLITASTAAFVLGGVFAHRCLDRPTKKIAVEYLYAVGDRKILLTALFMLSMAALNLQSMYELSVAYGNHEGYLNVVRTLRPIIERNELVFDRWISYRSQLAQAIACGFFYMFAFNLIFAGIRRWRLLIPTVCYLPFPILSTARMSVFFFVIYIIVVALILYQKKNQFVTAAKLCAARYLIGGGLTFIAIFFVMGALTGKTISEERTPFVILAHYIGLSIPALDELIHHPTLETNYIGSHSLHGIYRALQKFDPDMPSVPLFDPLVTFVGIDTNVYTALGHYFLDYGWLGTLLMMWILGAGYSLFYGWIKHCRKNFALPVMLYGIFCYPLFLISISERVLFDLVGTTFFYTLLLFWLSTKIFFRKVERRCDSTD